METQTKPDMATSLILSSWDIHNKRLANLLAKLSDADLEKEASPGRNRGTYLLGHLTAVSDALLPLLGLGERLYPQLDDAFIHNSDKAGFQFPPTIDLRENLQQVTAELNTRLHALTHEQWLEPHTQVTAEDFVKEPHRNKLNVLLSRVTHMSYHTGQLVFLL